MACPNCGSWAVRADRSLSGRMVCARCGAPLGIGAGRLRTPRRAGAAGRARNRRGLWLGLAALVAVAAILAARSERKPPGPAGDPAGMSPSPDRVDPGGSGSGIM
ncbi:MAG: hypothetical protein VKI81_00930 [Synechococcaceae cyanobacterium]|nr:hypothetical protein [Synechococcaceae cyanobacterium]